MAILTREKIDKIFKNNNITSGDIQNILETAEKLYAVVEASKELDGHTELCKSMTPYRGCICGIAELNEAMKPFTPQGGTHEK